MNERAINRLRKRFVFIALLSFLIVTLLMGSMIYFVNKLATGREIRNVTEYLVDNDGEFPEGVEQDIEIVVDSSYGYSDHSSDDTTTISSVVEQFLGTIFGQHEDNITNPADHFIIRYFAVIFDENGDVTDIKTSNIGTADQKKAVQLAKLVKNQYFKFGSFGRYYYQYKVREDGSTIVVFMDAHDQIKISKRILYIVGIFVFLGGLIMVWLLNSLSYKVIKPEIENAESQKQFITNASHELKTPLAVIRANTEMEQVMGGDNEWNQSTMRQVERMQSLIQNLVMVARAQEHEDRGDEEVIDISAPVKETFDTFIPVSEQNGTKMVSEISDDVKLRADESHIRQLATLLIDNAIKYCDENGTIKVELSQKGKTARLVVSDNYKAGACVDYNKFFDRFYREDASHHADSANDKGGFGIGLSIAEGLVRKYHGTIRASWKDGVIYFTCVLRNL